MPRKTKIICTLGPATNTEEKIRELILSGMDVARLNFSHGSHESHLECYRMVRKVSGELGMPVGILLDTKGPEIRLGTFRGGKALLQRGQSFTLTTRETEGDETIVSVSYAGLPGDVRPEGRILLDDGLIELRVAQKTETDILCTVVNGGPISDRKGVNLPGASLSMPYISQKDYEDILFGIETGFDFIAASFVRDARDVLEIRKILETQSCHSIKLISKIENSQGVENIDEILRVSDGIMIARGDMGVEIPLEEVPVLQKMLTEKVYSSGKLVITATQMLDSMMKNPRPTRAEATDVANAIYEGTSAIMLSGETAAGAYPIESVKTMSTIARRTEQDIDYRGRFQLFPGGERLSDVTNAISHATCTTALDLGAAAIITVTKSGQTAREISKFRPDIPIVGCTCEEKTYYQLALSWGVTPLMIEEKETTDELFEHAVEKAVEAGLIASGDLVVITAGVPLGISGTTNLLKVHMVGNILVSGVGVNQGNAVGRLCVAKDAAEAGEKFQPGSILVVPYTDNSYMELLRKASGIVTEQEGANSHAAVAGMALDIPVIVGAVGATRILKNGVTVQIDSSRGTVCKSGQ